MAQGWISLHRKVSENWIWLDDEPFDRRSAWIDLILMANHEDNKFLHGNTLEEVKRGSKITSIRKLSKRWKWSVNKVKRFLELLSQDNMIIYKSDSKKTTYTIVNYEVYQDKDIAKRNSKSTPTEHKRDADGTSTETNNNENNENNENNDNNIVEKFSTDSTEVWLSDYLYKKILTNDDKTKKPNIQKWAEHIDKLIRLDKRDPHEIAKVIDFATNDDFWKSNILSTSKLRQKYQTLKLQMQRNNKQSSNELSEATMRFLQKGD